MFYINGLISFPVQAVLVICDFLGGFYNTNYITRSPEKQHQNNNHLIMYVPN